MLEWQDVKNKEIDTLILVAGSKPERKGMHEGVQYLLQHREYGDVPIAAKNKKYFERRIENGDPVWFALYVAKPTKAIAWIGLVKEFIENEGETYVKLHYITSLPNPVRRSEDEIRGRFLKFEYASMEKILEANETKDIPKAKDFPI